MEADIENHWRTLYKLEKSFSEAPNALRIASAVKAKVESFKELVPMVQVKIRSLIKPYPAVLVH